MPEEARADALIRTLGLEPHPEGGHYRETYRSLMQVQHPTIAEPRNALTCIYFLLRSGEASRWHVVASDEVWTYLEGSGGLELITYDPAVDELERVVLGGTEVSCLSVARAVHTVPAGVWQAARPLGGYTLVSCSVSPGFDFADFAFVSDLDDCDRAFERATIRDHRALL